MNTHRNPDSQTRRLSMPRSLSACYHYSPANAYAFTKTRLQLRVHSTTSSLDSMSRSSGSSRSYYRASPDGSESRAQTDFPILIKCYSQTLTPQPQRTAIAASKSTVASANDISTAFNDAPFVDLGNLTHMLEGSEQLADDISDMELE